MGSWTNTTNQNNLMNALFSQSSGLGLNYLRYNIGGGNDPLCGTGGSHYPCITPWYHGTPGYEPSNGTYDWTQDATQRWVATHAQSLGANLFEAVSYSPPYWMTNSGTSEGGVYGADNLASGYYGSGSGTFADYLTTVTQHFATSFGISFHHLNPMNEPGAGQNWWIAGDPSPLNSQEGCAIANLSSQETLIQNVRDSLASKGLLAQVAAMDEFEEGVLNSPINTWPNADAAEEFYNYDPTTISDMSQINTHGYPIHDGKRCARDLGSPLRKTVDNVGMGKQRQHRQRPLQPDSRGHLFNSTERMGYLATRLAGARKYRLHQSGIRA